MHHRLSKGVLWSEIARRIPDKARVLLAVSGGADSMALLHMALPNKEEQRKRIAVGHVHHGTGQFADDACKLVSDHCEELGITFHKESVELDREERRKLGFEALARKLRYQALENIAEKHNYCLILTAHNSDDQAEGVLLYLMRGSGSGGVGGIRPMRGKLYRPLLDYSHQELCDFLVKENIKWIEDPSNSDTKYTRNRIRHVLRPIIEREFGARSWKNLSLSAGYISGADQALIQLTDQLYERCSKQRKPGWVLLETDELLGYLDEVRVRVIQRAFAHATGLIFEESYLTRKSLQRALRLLRAPGGESALLPGGVVLRKTENAIIFNGLASNKPVEWRLPGEVTLPDGSILRAEKRQISEFTGISEEPGRVEWVDAGKTGQDLIVRPWREGDRFKPIGRRGDAKVTRVLSGQGSNDAGPLWVVCSPDGEIVYIAGHRISREVAIKKKTTKVWRLTHEPSSIES